MKRSDGSGVRAERRRFLGAAAGTVAAAAVGGLAPSAVGRERLVPRGRLGIQLFTVRDAISRLDNSVIDPLTGQPLRGGFRGVFDALAAARIKEIEYQIERDTAPGGSADPGRSFRTAQRSADYLLALRA